MGDPETLSVYARRAEEYSNRFASEPAQDASPSFNAFSQHLPARGRVLDLGCGPGQWAARLRDAGFEVDATDASEAMAELAKQRFDLDVRIVTFDALDDVAEFDGIWANFSLLHAPKTDFPDHLARIHRALKPGGAFHLGTKLGIDEGRDHLGRFYSYYSEIELRNYLDEAGFTILNTRTGEEIGLAGNVDPFIIILAHA